MSEWLAALLAGASAWLAVRALPCPPQTGERSRGAADAEAPEVDWMRRHRLWWCASGGLAGALFVGGTAGLVAGVLAAVAVWVLIDRAEPPGRRKAREAVQRELPGLVRLLSAGLRGGASTPAALRAACSALPGAAADALLPVARRLDLGVEPESAWSAVSEVRPCAALGRALARAEKSGGSVVTAVERLAEDLERSSRSEVEQRARSVGVKAALPLGVCLLPAFLLLGVVPMVVGLLGSLQW